MPVQTTPQPGSDLAWANRDVLAARLRWPAGALSACKLFDLKTGGWMAWWRPENTLLPHPAGFMAQRLEDGQWRCGVELEDLAAAVDTAPEGQHWVHRKVCCSLVRADPWRRVS